MNLWMICLAVCLPTFMEVLDTTVANVALPHMGGSLAASNEEATWILTSYLVSNAIVLPASSWMGRTFGRKRFLQVCIAVFTLASAACGMATSLNFMLLARVLQGLGGGALQPTSQAILFESFPVEKRGQAAALYGLSVVVAPVLGPTLGGWITDNYNWRWIFFINVPTGLLAMALIHFFIFDPPYLKSKKEPLDVPGLIYLSLWVAAFQVALDQGQLLDWFQSPVIVGLTATFVIFLALFIHRELTTPAPLVDLSVLKDRNTAAAATLYGVMGIVLFSTNTLLPLYLQGQMGYPAFQSGLTASPRGLAAFFSMLIVGRIVSKVDGRLLVAAGFIIIGSTTFWLGHLSPEIAMGNVALPVFLSGVSVALIFVPLTSLATASQPLEKIGSATGITSLTRNLGAGIGVSLATVLVQRSSQAHQTWLAGHMSNQEAAFRNFSQHAGGLLAHHYTQVEAQLRSSELAYRLLRSQAALLGYIDAFQALALMCIACIPLILLLKKAQNTGGPISLH